MIFATTEMTRRARLRLAAASAWTASAFAALAEPTRRECAAWDRAFVDLFFQGVFLTAIVLFAGWLGCRVLGRWSWAFAGGRGRVLTLLLAGAALATAVWLVPTLQAKEVLPAEGPGMAFPYAEVDVDYLLACPDVDWASERLAVERLWSDDDTRMPTASRAGATFVVYLGVVLAGLALAWGLERLLVGASWLRTNLRHFVTVQVPGEE